MSRRAAVVSSLFGYRTRQGPLYLALVFQLVIVGIALSSDYTRALSVVSGCAAGTTGLVIRVIRDLRTEQVPPS